MNVFSAIAVAGGPTAQVLERFIGREGSSLRQWRKRGERNQAIGRSCGRGIVFAKPFERQRQSSAALFNFGCDCLFHRGGVQTVQEILIAFSGKALSCVRVEAFVRLLSGDAF